MHPRSHLTWGIEAVLVPRTLSLKCPHKAEETGRGIGPLGTMGL